jgi:type IV secretory pathway TraG/TraD family ATPase VirD4
MSRLDKLLLKLRGSPASIPERPPTVWEELASHPDAYGALIVKKIQDQFRLTTQLGYSIEDGTWATTLPRTHTLVLGPSQSRAGKTSGYMIPTVLTQGGPVVVYSTKRDIARNTALARSRLGTVWHYDPTGGPCPPGYKELHWSPLAGAKDWNSALEIASQMAAAADPSSQSAGRTRSESGSFFESRSGDLLACVLHFAARTNRDMGFVVSRISSGILSAEGHRENRPNMRDSGPDFMAMINGLDEMGSHQAADKLDGIVWSNDRSRSDVFSTADTALRGYQGTALRSATGDSFPTADFVVGQPKMESDLHPNPGPYAHQTRLYGRYDTIYITVPVDKQRLYAPLVIGLLSAIKREVYKLNEVDQLSDQALPRRPVTFVLDEMYGAPLPDLPVLLAEGAGQGLLPCGALQDLSQAVARWVKSEEHSSLSGRTLWCCRVFVMTTPLSCFPN